MKRRHRAMILGPAASEILLHEQQRSSGISK
jgi:hypothetical protein